MSCAFFDQIEELKKRHESDEPFDSNYVDKLVQTLVSSDIVAAPNSKCENILAQASHRYSDLSRFGVVILKSKETKERSGLVVVFRERFKGLDGKTFSDVLQSLKEDHGCKAALAIGFQSNPNLVDLANEEKRGIYGCHFTKIPGDTFERALDFSFSDSTEQKRDLDKEENEPVLTNSSLQVTDKKENNDTGTDVGGGDKVPPPVSKSARDRDGGFDDGSVLESLNRSKRGGKLAIYAGAGVSIPFGLPNWYDLIKETIRELAGKVVHSTETNRFIADLAAILQNSYSTTMFSTFVTHYCDEFSKKSSGSGIETPLKEAICEVISTRFQDINRLKANLSNNDMMSNIIGQICANLKEAGDKGIQLLTTNYDPILELSMLTKGCEPDSTWCYEQRKEERPQFEVCHLHGFTLPFDERIVNEAFDPETTLRASEWFTGVKESEKLNPSTPVLLENTYDQIRENPYCFPLFPLLQAFDERTVLVVGSSLTDINLRLMAKKSYEMNFSTKHYALMRVGDDLSARAIHRQIENSPDLKKMRNAPFEQIGIMPLWKTDEEIANFLKGLL